MEKFGVKNSLWNITHNPKEAAAVIAETMIQTRPRGEICYRPYRICDAVYQTDILGSLRVEPGKLYPEAKEGDFVYIGTVLESVADYEISLCVTGDVKVFYEGEVVYDANGATDWKIINIDVKEGENEVLFLCRCGADGFGMTLVPSVRHYPGMWAKDYLLHVRACSPIAEFHHEDGVGISRLYRKDEDFDGIYVYPEKTQKNTEIRFDKIFPEGKGDYAYALTYCIEDTMLMCNPVSEGRIIINGESKDFGEPIALHKGDTVLIKSERGEQWGFSFKENEHIGIPFLQSNRSSQDRWLTIGTFGKGDCMDIPMGPETELQFNKPYRTNDWTDVYWRLDRCDDVIRPYLDTCFFGQWFYALMVGSYGLLCASKTLKEEKYQRYFIDGMKLMAQYFTYANYDAKCFGDPTFMARATKLIDLDSIGTMGMNLAELYRMTGNADALYTIYTLKDAMFKNIPRFSDGTFYRGETMWADDVFMSCPFLVRLGKITGDKFYFEECVRQIKGFKERLWRQNEQLFSHIYFVNEQAPNEISWGRGNGWIFISTAELLELLPHDTKGYDELKEMFKAFAQGVLKNQDNTGMWHQILDNPESYTETSCTGMYIIGMCKGIRMGLLERSEYEPAVRRAYEGLMKYAVDSDGNIFGVCKGSNCSMDPQYYMELGTVKNDDHGTGILLYAFSEIIRSGICENG